MSSRATLQRATEIVILKAFETSKLWAVPDILFFFYIVSYEKYKDLRNPTNCSLSQHKGASQSSANAEKSLESQNFAVVAADHLSNA